MAAHKEGKDGPDGCLMPVVGLRLVISRAMLWVEVGLGRSGANLDTIEKL